MKCELCHANNAETVLYRRNAEGKREELYVCHACAERERAFEEERGIQITAMRLNGGAKPAPPEEPRKGADEAEDAPPADEAGEPRMMSAAEFFGEDEEPRKGTDEAEDAPPADEAGEPRMMSAAEFFGEDEEPPEDPSAREFLGLHAGTPDDACTRCPGCGATIGDIRHEGLFRCPQCLTTFPELTRTLLDDAQQCSDYQGDPAPGTERLREIEALERRLAEAIDREDYLEAKRLRAEIQAKKGEAGHDA